METQWNEKNFFSKRLIEGDICSNNIAVREGEKHLYPFMDRVNLKKRHLCDRGDNLSSTGLKLCTKHVDPKTLRDKG